MSDLKIVVIGLGSMGRRRIRLLKQMSDSYRIIGIDGRPDRREQAGDEFQIETYENLEDVLRDVNPECAVVSTSPLSHGDIIETCLKYNCNVFTELNLVKDKYDINMKLAEDKNKVLFLSSTMLYRKEVQYISDKINESGKLVNYNYHVGQYLPDWHPWETIQDYFVSDRRTNGCREIFAIELPWIVKTFGDIESFSVLASKNTGLPIDFNDNYMLLIKHSNGNKGVLCIDVMSRKAVSKLEVYGEDTYITWDGTPQGLHEYDCENSVDKRVDLYNDIDKQEGYAAFNIENAYYSELETFIELVDGKGCAKYTFEDDNNILSMIDKIEAGEDS